MTNTEPAHRSGDARAGSLLQEYEPRDIGDFLEVPPEQRRETDPYPELNDDAGADLSDLPEGEFVDLLGHDDDGSEAIGGDEPDDPGDDPDLED